MTDEPTYRLTRRKALLGAAAVGVAAACGPAAAPSPSPAASAGGSAAATPKGPPTKIAVAFGVALGNSSNNFAWIGRELGYFAEENIDPDIISTSGNIIEADGMLAANQIDVGIFGLDPILRAVIAGSAFPAKSVYNVQSKAQYELFTVGNSPITKVEDLKGKRAAVAAIGSTPEPYLRKALEEKGLKLDDVSQVATGTGIPMGEALKRGDADFGISTRGQVGPVEQAGTYNLKFLPRPAFFDSIISGNIVARSDLNPAKLQAVKGYLRAYTKSIVFVKASPEAGIRATWKMYPDAKPKTVADDVALKAAVATNVAYMAYIDKLEGKYGFMPTDKMTRYVDFLNLNNPKLGPLTNYWTNEYIDYANDFDVAKVQDQAKNYKP
jgi:NitT/TauT family transport system substrate-binding protein